MARDDGAGSLDGIGRRRFEQMRASRSDVNEMHMNTDEIQGDFRSTATVGIAVAAVTLLLPFAVVNLVTQAYSLAGGALLITATLVLAVLRVQRGHDYEKLVLRFFVPAGTLFLTHVYSIDGIVATVWCYPTIIAFYCILSRARAVAANALLLSVVMPLTFVTIDPALAARFCATLVAVSLFANILVREIDAMRQRLSFQIEHDPLTGLLNRHSLTTRLDAAIERAARSGGPAALLALDLDHFKTINDRFGHETGDRVLCEVARLLLARTDEDDAVFRIGGEEFLVLLGARGASDPVAAAEALRSGIERAGILQHHPVTASVGVAALLDADDRASWMRRGDERLYDAKRGGRNRVVTTRSPHVARTDAEPALPVGV